MIKNLILEIIFLYGGDNSVAATVISDDFAKKRLMQHKKIESRCMEESRLNLLEGAAIELSDNNIVEGTLRFKLANNLAGG